MNKAILMGRLTKDPEAKEKVTKYTLAVDRPKSTTDPEQNADFFNCVCFGHAKEFADKYLKQGKKILVEGRIQLGHYTNNDGQRVNTTDIIISSQEFAESKGAEVKKMDDFKNADFTTIPDAMEEELPFV